MLNDERLVYSSGPDGKVTCPDCRKSPCECPEGLAPLFWNKKQPVVDETVHMDDGMRTNKRAGLAGAPKKRTQTEPVRISFRRVGKGSGLTLVEKLPMHPAGKEELLKKFRKRLGVGGTLKLGVLELQGDHKIFVKTELEASGYKVKLI
ncbi:MAG: hypothetical protein NTX59_12770 [Elusimicrobia bacterium]|nr:hypothetical protein [Elusimicrobiota bacterium]